MIDLGRLRHEVGRLREQLPGAIPTHQVAGWKAVADELARLGKSVSEVATTLREVCADAIPRGVAYVMSDGYAWGRTGKPKLSEYDDEGLMRAVLDSRLVDRDTGELIEETPLERVLACWPHSGRDVRLRQLKARGIELDQFAGGKEWTNRDVQIVEP